MEIMTVNSREFVVKKLLGKGKSGLFSRHYHKILGFA